MSRNNKERSSSGIEMIAFKFPREMTKMKRKTRKNISKATQKIYRMRLGSSVCRKQSTRKCWANSSCKYVYGNKRKFCRKKYNKSINIRI